MGLHMPDDEYAEFRGDDANLKRVLSQLADELRLAQREVEDKKEELERAETAVKELAVYRIPEAADGLDGTFTLEDDSKLIIEEIIRASIKEEKREPAIQWLDENGYGSLVKRQITFEFDRKDHERYKRFLDYVKAYPETVVMKRSDSVHHATLTSWVREKLKEGVDLPKGILGIFRQREAKLKK